MRDIRYNKRTAVGTLRSLGGQLGPAGARRRAVIKYALYGAGAFLLGKILGPSISLFPSEWNGKIYNFKNFRVVENDQELGFYDKFGNEILILEKDPNAGK